MKKSLIFENRIGKVKDMVKPERKIHKCCGEKEKKVKYLRLGYVQREPPPRQKKTEKKDPKLLEKPIKPETGGGYCGGGSSCNGKKSCMECEEKPPVGIDYTRD